MDQSDNLYQMNNHQLAPTDNSITPQVIDDTHFVDIVNSLIDGNYLVSVTQTPHSPVS